MGAKQPLVHARQGESKDPRAACGRNITEDRILIATAGTLQGVTCRICIKTVLQPDLTSPVILEREPLKCCRLCYQRLPLTMFAPKRGKCHDCKREFDRLRYHSEAGQATRQVAAKRHYAEARGLLIRLKDKPCHDCGGTFPVFVMEFDHRDPTQKKMRVSAFAAAGHIPGMLAEIEKCDLVCSNCHRIRTHRQQELGLIKRGGVKKKRRVYASTVAEV